MRNREDFPIHIEWNGTKRAMRFYVGDCLRVDHYESTLVLIYTKSGAVRIGGQMLSLVLFDGGGVEINGRIAEVTLLYAK